MQAPKSFRSCKHHIVTGIAVLLVLLFCSACIALPQEKLEDTVQKDDTVTTDIPEESEEELPTEAPPETPQQDARQQVNVPNLMMHNFCENPPNEWSITPEKFEMVLHILEKNGYEPVSMAQLIGFVYRGEVLPEKPVCITLDDGYYSNYDLAFPLLRRYHMKATIFAIGSSIGQVTYKDTNIPITPHFSYPEAIEMMDSGLIEIQSHTYDMHQSPELERCQNPRYAMVPLGGETDEAFCQAIREDLTGYQQEFSSRTGRTMYALAYPKGQFSELTEQVVRELGYTITFTMNADHCNTIVKGKADTLYQMGRFNASEDVTEEQLLQYLETGCSAENGQ